MSSIPPLIRRSYRTQVIVECLYEVGVEDDGNPKGLADADLEKSLATLERMAAQCRADVQVLRLRKGVLPGTRVAELLVRRQDHIRLLGVC